MTKSSRGSSLPQAHDVHANHVRNHNYNHNHHARSHDHFHHRRQENTQSEDSSVVTEIIQTVSIVQVIDGSGAIVDVQTVFSSPNTVQVDLVTGVTIDSSDSNIDSPTAFSIAATAAVGSDDGTTQTPTAYPTLSGSVEATPSSSSSTDLSSSGSSVPVTSTSESSVPVTSAPSSTPSAFPTFIGATNSSRALASSSLFNNSTASFTSPTSLDSFTSSLFPLSGTFSSESASSTPILGTSTSFSSFGSATATITSPGNDGFGGNSGGSGATGSSSPSSTSSSDSGSAGGGGGGGGGLSSKETAAVLGGVFGGLAGAALVLVAILILLRHKKRRDGSTRESGTGGRGLLTGGALDDPVRDGGMAQRRSFPFAVPAALVALTGGKRFSQMSSSSGGEKGFYRVSGRKLQSVLQTGGDGYTDPRDTVLTDASFYRDSQGFYGGPGSPRLAVGSPMRPESGIPIFRSGPGRTPVTEASPFAPPSPGFEPSSPLEPPRRDPLGRSHPSQDGSNRSQNSGSRFTEEM